MAITARVAGILTLMALVGCGDSVSVSEVGGDLELRYRCPPAVSQLAAPGAESLIRGEAIRIIRWAYARGSLEELMPLRDAYDADDLEGLEREVVQHLCDHGDPELPPAPEREPEFPEPGTRAPPIALPLLLEDGTVSDSVVRLAWDEGEAVLLYFFSSWCAPCVQRYPNMRATAAQLSDESVRVYGVIHREAPWRTADWLRRNEGMAFPFLVDRDESVARAFHVMGIPVMFLLAPDGTVADRCLGCQYGSMSPDSLPALIRRVAARRAESGLGTAGGDRGGLRARDP